MLSAFFHCVFFTLLPYSLRKIRKEEKPGKNFKPNIYECKSSVTFNVMDSWHIV